ncbi:MAG: hypothetical protein ACD_72C00242G0005 [uncultured bacterium]|nr:MAG: hypothetical protein ACD_72C00242G0005 [uncultured bacterium]
MTKTTKQQNLSKEKTKFLEYYRHLPIQKFAAEAIGRSEDTICDWKNKDPNFANHLGRAKSAWVLEKAEKVKSAEWLLERIVSEYFKEKIGVENPVNEKLEQALERMAQIVPKAN